VVEGTAVVRCMDEEPSPTTVSELIAWLKTKGKKAEIIRNSLDYWLNLYKKEKDDT